MAKQRLTPNQQLLVEAAYEEYTGNIMLTECHLKWCGFSGDGFLTNEEWFIMACFILCYYEQPF